MSDAKSDQVVRQWVSAVGGSCDVRYGGGLVEGVGRILATTAGKPHACALVVGEGTDEALVERLRRQLTDGGFLARRIDVAAGPRARTTVEVGNMLDGLAREHITADDFVLAVGDVDTLSAVSLAAALWCGRVPLATVPLDLDSMVEVACTPRHLDVGGQKRIAGIQAFSKLEFCDPEVMRLDVDLESSRLARAIMVASAVAENENSFSRLWDKADLVMAGDPIDALDAALDCLKTRGHLVSSTSLSIKKSLSYGETFARVLGELAEGEVPASTCLGEALRFGARVSCSLGRLEVDDVLTQDELLDTFGIGEFSGHIDPQRLFDALKADRFLRSNRFHLALPQVIGRVRMTVVPDDVLMENLTAWCETHEPEPEDDGAASDDAPEGASDETPAE